jgi:hypothetical protein
MDRIDVIALPNKHADTSGGLRTVFKLELNHRALTKQDVDAVNRANQDVMAFNYETAFDGSQVARVPARIRGRSARVNHSTQETRGADVPTADKAVACSAKRRNHSENVEGESYKACATTLHFPYEGVKRVVSLVEGVDSATVGTVESVPCYDLVTRRECQQCTHVNEARCRSAWMS